MPFWLSPAASLHLVLENVRSRSSGQNGLALARSSAVYRGTALADSRLLQQPRRVDIRQSARSALVPIDVIAATQLRSRRILAGCFRQGQTAVDGLSAIRLLPHTLRRTADRRDALFGDAAPGDCADTGL